MHPKYFVYSKQIFYTMEKWNSIYRTLASGIRCFIMSKERHQIDSTAKVDHLFDNLKSNRIIFHATLKVIIFHVLSLNFFSLIHCIKPGFNMTRRRYNNLKPHRNLKLNRNISSVTPTPLICQRILDTIADFKILHLYKFL